MRISITVSNSLKKDPRVIKQVKCAIAAGYEVQFVGYRDAFYDKGFLEELGCTRIDIVDLGDKYVGKVASLWGKFKRRFFRFVLPVRYIREFKPDVVHSNDFDTLIYSYISAKLCKAAVIYDSHEVYAENIGISESFFLKRFVIFSERLLLPHIDKMICVSHAASEYFEKKYSISAPIVITNCPMRNKLPLKEKNNDHFEILYQGLMVAGRGYEEFVLSAKYLADGIMLVLRGYGSAEQTLRKLVEENGLSNKVIFDKPVEVAELISAASSSHVGVVLTRPVNLNFRLSISNKVFEYAHAGIPVVLSDVPEHRYLNDKYHFAIVIPEVTPKSIAEAIMNLYKDKELYHRLASNAVEMADEMNWEMESKRLIKIYKELS